MGLPYKNLNSDKNKTFRKNMEKSRVKKIVSCLTPVMTMKNTAFFMIQLYSNEKYNSQRIRDIRTLKFKNPTP